MTPLAVDPAAYDRLAEVQVNGDVTVTGFPLDAATRVDLVLERFDVLAPGGRVVVGTDAGDVEAPRPGLVLLRGVVDGRPGSSVFLAVTPRGTDGLIRLDGRRFVIAGRGGHADRPSVVYDLDALPAGALPARPFVCGTDELHVPQQGAPAALPGEGGEPTCGLVAEIAVETDWEFTDSFEGDTEASAAYVLTLIAAVSEIYEAGAGVGLVVSFVRVWETDDDPWTESQAGDQLSEFREYWNAQMQSVQRHTAHFLTTRQLEGAGGVAYLPGLCQGPWAYGLSAYINGSFPYPLTDNDSGNWDVVVVAHELGHNFGAFHTHNMDPPVDTCAYGGCENADMGTIMSYCHTCEGGIANILLHFHERVLDEHILPYLADVPCTLSPEGPAIVQHPSDRTVCVDDPTTFDVAASGGLPLLYQWRHDGVEIAGATAPSYSINAVQPGDAGSYDVVVSNDCGEVTSDAGELTVDPCDPGGGGCDGDIDGDNIVGITDFLAILADWGPNPGSPADLDGDGIVGIKDFLLVIANWGTC